MKTNISSFIFVFSRPILWKQFLLLWAALGCSCQNCCVRVWGTQLFVVSNKMHHIINNQRTRSQWFASLYHVIYLWLIQAALHINIFSDKQHLTLSKLIQSVMTRVGDPTHPQIVSIALTTEYIIFYMTGW